MKEIQVKRKYRVRRIKNKQEAAYRVPEFFHRASGVCNVTESGIWYGKEAAKIYPFHRDGEQQRHLMQTLDAMQADFAFLNHPGIGDYLVVYCPADGLDEAMGWFRSLEEKLSLPGLTLEQRLDVYVRFCSQLANTKKETVAGGYLWEPAVWKETALFSDFRWQNGCFGKQDACIKIAAVRKIDAGMERPGLWQKILGEHAYIKASIADIKWLSGEEVLQRLNARYLGLDGVMPALKNSNPALYGLLQKENGTDCHHFCMVSVYILLGAAEEAQLEKAVEELILQARKQGVYVEEMPLQYAVGKKETICTLSMFAGGGSRQARYQNLLSAEELGNFLVNSKEDCAGSGSQLRYMEEMKQLFFGECQSEKGEAEKIE